MKRPDWRTVTVNACRLGILLALLALWEWGWQLKTQHHWPMPSMLDPYFVSRPSVIWASFLKLGCFSDIRGFQFCLFENEQNIWWAIGATLRNTFWGFLGGVSLGVLAGLVLGRYEILARVFEPYVIAFNSLPRIALVPLIILLFGLGDMSKIVTAWVIVFFVVFFNAFEGARAVDRDHINAARLLGANEWQIALTVVIPSTMGWVFAALTPAVSFSLIGVIVGEFIGAEHGLGKMEVEAEGRGDATVMMVVLFVLMIIGVVLSLAIRRLQAYLLRWQAQFQERG
jgi:NitT/TauT family transport system permease protein